VLPVECATDGPIFQLVEDGELELGFVYLPVMRGPFAACELVKAPIVLLVAADSPLAHATRPPSLVEIARLPLISSRNCRLL